jgi:hypothetical protein
MLGSIEMERVPLRRPLRTVRSVARLVGPLLLVALAAWSRLGRQARDLAANAPAGATRLAGESGRRAAERWRERPAARRRRLAARARTPLPILYDVHPEARRAMGHDVGLRSVPLDEIVGTAVAGPAQRGGDFLPLPDFRSTNWQGRFARVQRATDSLAILPPVDLVKYGDGYWVEDGHNRVAAALYNGQQDIDAVVRELKQPGYVDDDTHTVATLAPVAAVGSELRAAGLGRFNSEAATEVPSLDLDGDTSRRSAPARPAQRPSSHTVGASEPPVPESDPASDATQSAPTPPEAAAG